jgi:serine/threonine protein phosphatase PrpC
MTTLADLQIGQASDVGQVRSLNQDCVSCFVPEDEVQCRDKGALFLVADGMGGHNAGEVASQEAVARVQESYYADATHDVGASLRHAFEGANQALGELAEADPAKAGMGTTLVAAAIRDGRATVANVGDSRAYLLRGKRFTQLTVDHSWVAEQVHAGELTREQAKRHPHRNLITRALGSKPEVKVHLFEIDLHKGDVLLLCTDGLSGPVSEQKMAQALSAASPQDAADDLVAQANERGGADNISVVIVQVGSRPTRTDLVPALSDLWARESRQRVAVALAALIVLCLLAMLLSLPVANQQFVGAPKGAPYPAPIRFEGVSQANLAGLAADLGYASEEALADAHPELLAVEEAAAVDLWPAMPGVFVVGLVRDWKCKGQMCEFRLEMAGANFRFQLDRTFLVDSVPSLRGRHVRVFGQRQPTADLWDARLVDRGARWWARWQPAWVTVYQNGDWGDPAWVYSIADRDPYSIVRMEDYPGLQRGESLLASGRWGPGNSAKGMALTPLKLYHLEAGVYMPLLDGAAPVPQPTVTLRPTDRPNNR